MRRYTLAVLLIVAAAASAAALWFHHQTRGKWAPAFGGSNLSVRLADTARFRQDDPRWAAEYLGQRQDGDTLKSAGCTVTSVAMAMSNLGHAIEPGQLNAALAAAGSFTPQGWLVWEGVNRVTKGAIRAEVHAAPSLDKLDACLAAGRYPIVKFLIGGVIPHWVVLVGKDKGTYYMRDPLIDGPDPVPLTRRTPVILSVRCIGKAPQTAARRGMLAAT